MAAALQYATGFRRDLPEKKWQRISRNIVAAMAAIKDSLNLDVSNSSLTELFPGSDIPVKLLSDIRLHFDSLPNSYSQAGFDIKEIRLHLRLAKQAADDGQPAFQIQRISDQSNVFKIVFVCRSTFSLPTMSGAIGGSVICFKKTLIFEKKGFTLGVVTVCIDARFEKNFKHRIESALRSAAKNHRNAGVKLHFRLCGCREEGFVTLNENNSVFSAISEINARPIRRIHLPTPVPEIIFSGGAELSSRWLLRSEEIEFVERAGINSFIGTYRGKKVWIKKLKRCERGNAYEIEIQQKLIGLMSCGHKKLLQFCGICFNDGLCVVTRLMEGGSVHDLMQRKKVRVGDIVRIGLDVSEGLLFMNSHGLAYRDLNRKRILLDGEGHACLGDMGVVTTCMNPWQATEIRVSDGYQWLAPEIIAADPENKTETWMSNVYSFGMVLWEMVTGEVAYSSYSPVQAAVGIAAYGMRPEIPKDCPPVLRSLMIRCWNNSPSKRPQLSEIVAILSKKKISVG